MGHKPCKEGCQCQAGGPPFLSRDILWHLIQPEAVSILAGPATVDGGQPPTRKRKSRWEEPSPSTAVALVNVPKEITLPGGIKVMPVSQLTLRHCDAVAMATSSSSCVLENCCFKTLDSVSISIAQLELADAGLVDLCPRIPLHIGT